MGRLAGVAALAMLVATGCSTQPKIAPGASPVNIVEQDFKVVAPATVPAGKVTFVVHGSGPTMHEFNVAWTDLPISALPVTDSGVLDDEQDTAHFHHLGEIEGIDIGGIKTLTVTLDPNQRFVLYCNMDGHFMAHMATIVQSGS